MQACGDMSLEELAAVLAARPREARLCELADQLKGAVVKDSQRVIEYAQRLAACDGATPRSVVRAVTALAHARAYRNEFDLAIAGLQEALRIAREAGLREELAAVHLAMVQPLARSGRLVEAKGAAEQAITLANEARAAEPEGAWAAGLAMVAAKAEVNLGGVLMMLGEPRQAIACYDSALAGAIGRDPIARAMITSNRAEALLELDLFDEASQAFAEATTRMAEAGHLQGAAITEGNQADLLSRMGRVDEAVQHFESARRLLLKVKASGDAARLMAEQAEALFAAGAARASLPLFEESVPTLMEAGMKRERARALLAFGLAQLRLGQAKGARRALEEAIDQAGVVGAAAVQAEAHLAMGELEGAGGDAAKAREHLAEAERGLRDRPVRMATVRAVQGAIELQAGDAERAIELIDDAEAQLAGVEAGALRARLGQLMGLCLRSRGEVVRSRDVLLEAVRRAEAVRGSINAEQIRRSYLESAGKLYKEAIASVMAAAGEQVELRDAAMVFDLSERLRQRTLLDQLTMPERTQRAQRHAVGAAAGEAGDEARAGAKSGPVTAGWLDEVSREEAAYVQQLNAMYAQLGPAGRAVLSGKNVQTTQRLRELEQAAATCRLAAEAKGMKRRGLGEPMGLEAFCQRLPEACAVVNFVLDGRWLSAQVITRGGCVMRREVMLIEKAEYLARRFEMALSRGMRLPEADSAALHMAREIRHRCIGPLEPWLKDVSELLIVPAGPLHACPLIAAGIGSDGAGRAQLRAESLAAGCTLAALSPESGLFAQRRAADGREGGGRGAAWTTMRVLLAGVRDAAAPRMEDEVTMVMRHWRQASVLRGAHATAEAVLMELPEADVVHLACHAVFDPEFPGSSRLMLADRWMTTRELAGRLKPGAIVILAGCNTGRSGELDGEDRSGFVRSIIASGASAVLTAMWPLHDEAAMRLFDAWHAGLAAETGIEAGADARELSDEKSLDGCITGCTSSLILANNLRKVQSAAQVRGEAFYQWGGLVLTKGL